VDDGGGVYVKRGYKQTNVGVIPEEWRVASVGDLVQDGIIEKPFDGNHGAIHPKGTDFVETGIPFVMANDVSGGNVDLVNCHFITRAHADSLRKGFSVTGDVLLTHKATIGNTAIVGPLSTDYIMLTPQVTYYRVANPGKLSNQFLRQYFDSKPFQTVFRNLAGGGTRAYLGIVGQWALPVMVPPIDVQRAIAAALSDVDALIASLDRLIAKKRDLKQAAMQQLLTGQTRLPGFGGKGGFKKTELGPIPKDWEIARLNELVDQSRSIRYGIVQPGEYDPNGRLMIRGQDYSKGWVTAAEMFRVSAIVEARYRNARVKGGDLIITIVGAGTGNVDEVPGWLEGANLTQTTARLAIDASKAVSAYCKAILQSNFGKSQVSGYIKGAAQPGLNCGDIEKFLLPLPPSKQEQSAIASVLSDMDAEIAALEQRRDKTKLVKQGMMQELLTGRVRLV
jgi:type I restriction enzyme, S subunit